MTSTTQPPVVLVIAGNDPSGGAGICADIQAITASGAHPAPVLTSLTIQDTVNARAVEAVDAEFVRAQAEAVLQDLPVRAIKLGLLATALIGRQVATLLRRWPDIPVVTDPVLVAAGGADLAEEALVDCYLEDILPLTSILTPNALEIRRLAGNARNTASRVEVLLAKGARHVLVKGGDEDTPDVKNALYSASGLVGRFDSERLDGEFHGSGCTLASAIAAALAHGLDAKQAVEQAQAFTFNALRNGWRPSRHPEAQFIPLRKPFLR